MIKCITFDLDDTLWAVDPVIRQANQTLWQWLEDNAPLFTASYQLADLAEGSVLRRGLMERMPEITHSVSLIRIKLMEQGCIAAGYTETEAILLAERAFEVFMQARHQVELYEHAQAMLEQLRLDGYIIGALSNGNAEVAQTPLGNLFDFQFNADRVGYAKPHPRMFEDALKHTGLRPEQVVHVGDHPDNDIRAAAEVGMWTLWVNLPGHDWPQPARADARVECLSMIPQEIKRLAALGEVRATL